ncbi:ABC transporter substrate-binding protein [Mycobacterium sp. NAZ190054]|uniref:ABC transporter substrate-binding protein n=1 Tax=Mycobacterium sp. NAZ190054 TaxID=1747766 RepID=UPI000792C909|nr:extracellular solute-binding protein [Mycobacterium sp. NAZ190054]KWX68853.1 hypothetical protein ASJ79_16000 [Mycobacterium sp. NAZ190054]
MKFTKLAAAGIVAGMTLITGCGGGGSDTPAAGPVAPENDPFAALAEQAEAEGGKLNYYFILGEEANRELFDAFKARYPFVDIEVTSGNTLQLIERVVSENRSGNPNADIIQGGPLEERIINGDNNLGMSFTPAGIDEVDEDLKLGDGRYLVADYFTFPLSYNSEVLSEEEAPKSLEELTDPKWRGKFGIDVEQIDWFAGELAYHGEDAGMDLMRRLAANDPVVFTGTQGYEQVAAGSLPVAVNLFSAVVGPYLDRGAPIAFAKSPYVIAQPDVYIGLDNAPHPATTQLFFEWLMTEDAQKILASGSYKNPVLGDVAPPEVLGDVCATDCELFFVNSENFGDFDTRVNEFQSLFVR